MQKAWTITGMHRVEIVGSSVRSSVVNWQPRSTYSLLWWQKPQNTLLVDLHSPTDRQKILHRVTKLWWIQVAVKYRFPSRYFAFFRILYRTAWSNHGSGKYNSKPWFDFGFEQLLHLPLWIQLCFSQFLHLVHGFPSLCLSQSFWCDHLDT